jgi:hypothetical protein
MVFSSYPKKSSLLPEDSKKMGFFDCYYILVYSVFCIGLIHGQNIYAAITIGWFVKSNRL